MGKHHGWYGKKTYTAWAQMKSRCKNRKMDRWHRYGGRGITYSPDWEEFKNFLKDMGECPEGMSLDRINNDGNYEKGNCRWATSEEQARNCKNSLWIEHEGERLHVSEWAKRTGINSTVIHNRIKRGWSVERALSPREKDESLNGEDVDFLLNEFFLK